MRKLFISAIALVMAAGSLGAKNLDEARIYLNPGHGSWGPNDRPMATIPYPNLAETGMPDTCGFYESNTNLWKVLKLGKTLEKMGARRENIMYSRTANGPFPYVKGAADAEKYNRNLSEICEEVDANNMDFFLSVHSNAASEGTNTNYPLFLYRGYDSHADEYAQSSYEKATTVWPYLKSNELDPMTAYATSMNIRGDIDFYHDSSDRTGSNGVTYTGYLGVLKHGCPGFLSEGYFHTYQPARHRALNSDYCGQEGIRYARGIAKYFGATGENTGYIMGYVKDLHEKIDNPLFKYSVGSDDQWLPINGATVELYKNGTKVDTYNVDNNYNGIFVFENLEPGEYTLNYIANEYKAPGEDYTKPVTVKANETTYVKAFLESENYVPPVPDPITYYNYPDPVQDGYLLPATQYNMTTAFDGNAIDVLADKTVRRSILRGDSLYVLAVDAQKAPYIYIINPETQAVIKTLNTTGTQGGIYAISDITFTADNVLIGCNMEETQFTPAGTFRVYKWNDLDAAPAVWFTSQKSGNFNNANTGQTIAYTGTSKNGKLITSAVTTGSSLQVRVLIYTIEDGVNTVDVRNQNANEYTAVLWGTDFSFTVSPRADDNIIVDGSNTTPIEFKTSPADVAPMEKVGDWNNAELIATSTGANYFKYGKHALMVVPSNTKEAEENAGFYNTGIKLFDITNGLDNAISIEIEGPDFNAVHGVNYTMGAAKVENADISLYLVNAGATTKMAKYTTKSVAQPVVKGVYAYGLSVESTADAYTFKFTANDNAHNGAIIFTDAVTGKEAGSKSFAPVKGENSVTVNKNELPYGNKLNWAVRLEGNAIPTIAKLNEKSDAYKLVRGTGVVVDNSPESDYFGRIYVNNYDKSNGANSGIFAFNADWTPINTVAYGSSYLGTNYRIGIGPDGKVYIPDWSDPNSGIYIADPANLEGEFLNLFRNNTRDGNGLFTNTNGVAVGGSSPGVYVLGTGENTTLYCYSEDIIVNGNGNNVVTYNIGTDKNAWDEAPNKVYPIGKLQANTNGNIIADENGGVWVAQTRSSGNNTDAVPVLIYVNAEGNVVYNSGISLAAELNGCWGSGFTITNDGKTLIINNEVNEFMFFDLTWNEGVPVLTYKYKYKHDIGEGSGNIYQMTCDAAGNLYAVGAYLGIYSLPTSENQTTVPAKKSMAIEGRTVTAVAPTNAAAVENEDGTVTLTWDAPVTDLEYTYNLYLDNEKVGTAEATATSYDFAAPGAGRHVFGVTAVYIGENESEAATSTLDTSLEDNIVANTKVSAYPNPVKDMIHINAPEEIVIVRIFSATGSLVMEANSASVDVSRLPAGVYLLKVNNLKTIQIIKK